MKWHNDNFKTDFIQKYLPWFPSTWQSVSRIQSYAQSFTLCWNIFHTILGRLLSFSRKFVKVCVKSLAVTINELKNSLCEGFHCWFCDVCFKTMDGLCDCICLYLGKSSTDDLNRLDERLHYDIMLCLQMKIKDTKHQKCSTIKKKVNWPKIYYRGCCVVLIIKVKYQYWCSDQWMFPQGNYFIRYSTHCN